nr:PREDICTED: protein Tob1-like [Bemisia tabaci]
MHIEIQVALNFVISYLYNKLPRRRVNIFGEELEKALKEKFRGHWYPEKPFKGSAFRCIKTGDPVDPVLEKAARESGVLIQDILENLPQELAVWVDPGEVSYRIGEKGAVKVLFSESIDHQDDCSADREVNKTFNPEAQCFRPIDAVVSSLSQLNISPNNKSSSPPFPSVLQVSSRSQGAPPAASAPSANTSPTPSNPGAPQFGTGKVSPTMSVNSFLPRSSAAPLTFTTATFAQTKFGSTKLKTSSKRANRMSPTEFSNYIKQRALQQQQMYSHTLSPASPGGRSLSPHADFYFQQHSGHSTSGYPGHGNGSSAYRNMFAADAHTPPFVPELYPKFPSYLDPPSTSQLFNSGSGAGQLSSSSPAGSPMNPAQQSSADHFGLGSYPASPYQHLLVAN